jgi:hypothetical protein
LLILSALPLLGRTRRVLAIELRALLLRRLGGPAIAFALPITLALLRRDDALLGRLVVRMPLAPAPCGLALPLGLGFRRSGQSSSGHAFARSSSVILT